MTNSNTTVYKNINTTIGVDHKVLSGDSRRDILQLLGGRNTNLQTLFLNTHDKKHIIIAYKGKKAVGFILSSQRAKIDNTQILSDKVTIVRLKGEPDIREGLIRQLIGKYNNKNIRIETGPYTRATNNTLKMFQNLKFGITHTNRPINGPSKYTMTLSKKPKSTVNGTPKSAVSAIEQRYNKIVNDGNVTGKARKLEISLIKLLHFLNYHREKNGFVLKPYIEEIKYEYNNKIYTRNQYKIKLIKTNNKATYTSPNFGSMAIGMNKNNGGQGEEDVRKVCIDLMKKLRSQQLESIFVPKSYNVTNNNKEIIVSTGTITPIYDELNVRHITAFVEMCKKAIQKALNTNKTKR